MLSRKTLYIMFHCFSGLIQSRRQDFDFDLDLDLCVHCLTIMEAAAMFILFSCVCKAENEGDRIDWMNKTTGVISSLLNNHLKQTPFNRNSLGSALEALGEDFSYSQADNTGFIHDDMVIHSEDSFSSILQEIPGNDSCAECGAPDPDWAFLNLGILMCIECSGVHRNLGVHISKVRSINLDVKVWEPTVMDLFRNLGNAYCNSVWEGLLQKNSKDGPNALDVTKPSPGDANQQREKYIIAKGKVGHYACRK